MRVSTLRIASLRVVAMTKVAVATLKQRVSISHTQELHLLCWEGTCVA
jgi:hypothetical protein